MISDLTPEYVKSILEYDSASGVFTWKENRWRSVKAGEVAGGMHKDGYLDVRIKVFGCRPFLHRLAFLVMTGSWPVGQVDHLNGNRTDNRWENLRDASKGQNMRNRCLGRHNTSGVMGVHWCKTHQCWRSRIDKDKKKYSLGYFSDFFEAVCARKSAENRLDYHKNHGRRHERFGRSKKA